MYLVVTFVAAEGDACGEGRQEAVAACTLSRAVDDEDDRDRDPAVQLREYEAAVAQRKDSAAIA